MSNVQKAHGKPKRERPLNQKNKRSMTVVDKTSAAHVNKITNERVFPIPTYGAQTWSS